MDASVRGTMLVNAYCTHRSPPPLAFAHTLRSRRDRSDPELGPHLRGFMGFVMGGGKRPMTQVRYHVLRHLERVRHQFALDVEDAQMNAFAAWAREANALVFLPDTGPDVAARCLALFACALRAESLGAGKQIPTAEIQQRLPLAFDAMSPKERAFFTAPAPERQEVVNHVWRYESLATLAWTVGAVSDLPPPTRLCDVPALARGMLGVNGDAFVQNAKLRPCPELLDALDVHFRFHWATTDARLKKTTAPAGLDAGVVQERHYALNWLTRFEGAAWDDVQTPT
jgi:hypothetical protein